MKESRPEVGSSRNNIPAETAGGWTVLDSLPVVCERDNLQSIYIQKLLECWSVPVCVGLFVAYLDLTVTGYRC